MFTKKYTFLCFLTFTLLGILPFAEYAYASTLVNADIESNTTWSIEGSPYIIENSINVLKDAILTIEPGVVVKFTDSNTYNKNSINIDGNLNASGTKENPIYFTSIYDDSVGGDTDGEPYEFCYDDISDEGDFLGEICELIEDMPSHGDWDDIAIYENSKALLENVFIKYGKDGLTFFNSSTGIMNNVSVTDGDDGLSIFTDSHVTFSDLNISNMYDDPVTIFNNSSFIGEKLKIENIFSTYTDAIVLFNNSVLSLDHATFKDCPYEACITFFDGDEDFYKTHPSSVFVDHSLFDGGAGSAFLTFSDSTIKTEIKNSVIRNFASYGIENYSNITINAKSNDWGDSSGPYQESINPTGKGSKIYGNAEFNPWIGQKPPVPEIFYAKIKDAPNGVAQMYSEPNTTSILIKTFPNDWILKIFQNTITPDGWVKVQDMTDESFGWMKAVFVYEEDMQGEFEENSVDNLSGGTNLENRRTAVLNTVNHYYNNTQSNFSLYSSDDITAISKLKLGSFPEKVILAIIASESGGGPKSGFSNELVTYDYGHGIMQVTMDSHKHEKPKYGEFGFKKNNDDPRGFFSSYKVEICKEKNSDLYKKCYENTDSYNKKSKPYSNYDHDANNIKYKQYANTIQSIYSNIKDGLGILIQKYNSAVNTTFSKKNPCVEGKYNFEGYGFSCEDIVKIKTVWYYNGKSYPDPDDTNYLKLVSTNLKNLNKYFPGYVYENKDNFIEKLAIANKHRIEIQPRSPIEVAIKDSNGNILGLIKNEEFSDISTGAYDSASKRAVIFFPDDTYTYEVVGDSEGGTYGLDIDIFDDSDEPISFRAIDLPIIPSEKHIYKVDEEKLKNNLPNAVSVSIDKDGDGVAEKVIYSGAELTSLEQKEITPTIIPQRNNGGGALLLLNNLKPKILGAEINIAQENEVSKNNTEIVKIKKKISKKIAQAKIKEKSKLIQSSATLTEIKVNKTSWFRKLWSKLFDH